jgi:hypothetical protein
VGLNPCLEDQGSSHHSGGNSHSEKLCNKSHLEFSQNASCCKAATLQSCQNASCQELATQQFNQKLPCYEAAPLGGLRGRPVQKCTLICLILLAYSLFLAGNKTCSYTLPVVQSFCQCVCCGFSEMFRGLFHKQGDGGFTSGSTEIVNCSLKTTAVALDHAEAKPPDGRPHWGTASPPPASVKSSETVG